MQICKMFYYKNFFNTTLDRQLNQYLKDHPNHSVRTISTSMKGETIILVVVFDVKEGTKEDTYDQG